MRNRQRRLKAIELTLTPQQVVVVWLRNAIQAGTFEEAARGTPPPGESVANAVRGSVRNSMKGQPELLVEGAVLQARREADMLYNLVIQANVDVFESRLQREREYILLLGYLSAEMRAKATKVETLRLAVLMFLERVIILDRAIAQLASERLNGQPVLFRDSSVKLEEQLQMAEELAEDFNLVARGVDVAPISLEELRNSLQPETDRQVGIWVRLARSAMLSTFGTEKEMHAAMEEGFFFLKSSCGETSDHVTES